MNNYSKYLMLIEELSILKKWKTNGTREMDKKAQRQEQEQEQHT